MDAFDRFSCGLNCGPLEVVTLLGNRMIPFSFASGWLAGASASASARVSLVLAAKTKMVSSGVSRSLYLHKSLLRWFTSFPKTSGNLQVFLF